DEWKIGDSFGVDENGELQRFNIVRQQKEVGDPLFTTGHLQSYNVNMRGGTDNARYYLATEYQDNTGYVSYNWDKRLSLRANVSVIPSPQWSIDVALGYVDGKTRFAQPNNYEVWSSARWST